MGLLTPDTWILKDKRPLFRSDFHLRPQTFRQNVRISKESVLTGRLRSFDRRLLTQSGFLEQRVLEPEPPCWFCTATSNPSTNEHVFPRWLQKSLGVERQMVAPIRLLANMLTIGSQRLEHPISALTVGNICQNCNSGWMSRLEQVAPEVNTEHQTGRVSIDQSKVLARWMTKTAVCLNVSTPYRLLFDATARHALSEGMPTSTYVFILRARKDTNEINWAQGGQCLWFATVEDLGLVKSAMALTYYGRIHLGKLSALVVNIPDILADVDVIVKSDAAQIWPPSNLPT